MLKPLIAANWKMHGDMSWGDKPAQFNQHLDASRRSAVDVLICPPFPFIAAVSDSAKNNAIHVGAQVIDPRPNGAQTGQVNAGMAKSAGASFVIAGHSERREMGESNDLIREQVEAILDHDLTPVLCIGESLETRESGQADSFVAAQLKACWPKNLADGTEVVVAYEPIWAIGTGKVPSLEDIEAMHSSIRSIIGASNRILYGGSVKPANAQEILALPNVNGALVGGASLEMESFAAIAAAALAS